MLDEENNKSKRIKKHRGCILLAIGHRSIDPTNLKFREFVR